MVTTATSPSSVEPAKIVLERRVKPDGAQAFDEWLHRVLQSAAATTSLQGSSVLTTGNGEYFVLLRFASEGDLHRWQRAPDVVSLMAEGDRYATARAPELRTGLETWFTLPGMAAEKPPPKWKMALVTWLALVPQVIVLAQLVPPSWPFLANVAITTAIPVSMLTWFIMPRLTALLYKWLYCDSVPTVAAPRGQPSA